MKTSNWRQFHGDQWYKKPICTLLMLVAASGCGHSPPQSKPTLYVRKLSTPVVYEFPNFCELRLDTHGRTTVLALGHYHEPNSLLSMGPPYDQSEIRAWRERYIVTDRGMGNSGLAINGRTYDFDPGSLLLGAPGQLRRGHCVQIDMGKGISLVPKDFSTPRWEETSEGDTVRYIPPLGSSVIKRMSFVGPGLLPYSLPLTQDEIMAALQPIPGHASIEPTQLYARLSEAHVGAEAEKVYG